jgi:CheY-like chemotaxis protein
MNQKLNCILLIDDDEPTNFLSSMIIEEADCAEHIQVEDSALRAIDYLAGNGTCHNPDLIFLDINMPAMNGWEFIEKYKKLGEEHKNKVIIIMLTTSLNPDDKIRADETPEISGFALKPLTTEMVNKVLEEHFNWQVSKPV